MKYVALLRGINVGGNKKVPMVDLKLCFESLGHNKVRTYINSGNVIFESSSASLDQLKSDLERSIQKTFGFFIDVLVISGPDFKKVITQAPKGFGQKPDIYYSDVAFLLEASGEEALEEFELHPEVDTAWSGKRAVYYQRLGEKRTKSKISKIMAKPLYKRMTIRNWNTVNKLAALLEEAL
jgi:uncharacterized protein (DUF1697 family)